MQARTWRMALSATSTASLAASHPPSMGPPPRVDCCMASNGARTASRYAATCAE